LCASGPFGRGVALLHRGRDRRRAGASRYRRHADVEPGSPGVCRTLGQARPVPQAARHIGRSRRWAACWIAVFIETFQSGSRAAISVISSRASVSLDARGSSRTPASSTSRRLLWSCPKVSGPMLPTSKRNALALALGLGVLDQVFAFGCEAHADRAGRACARSLWATVSRMSGFSTKLSVGALPLPSFLILCWLCAGGRQSATAAVATKTVALPRSHGL
jgi:hypothetical protein